MAQLQESAFVTSVLQGKFNVLQFLFFSCEKKKKKNVLLNVIIRFFVFPKMNLSQLIY
jgi:hypothetical protein